MPCSAMRARDDDASAPMLKPMSSIPDFGHGCVMADGTASDAAMIWPKAGAGGN